MRPIYPTRKYLLPVFVPEAKAIIDAPLDPMYLVSCFQEGRQDQPNFVVDSDTISIHSKGEESVWDDERRIVALRKYYALHNKAENTVSESKMDGLSVLHFCTSV